jgi:hypothetical protein
VKKKICMRKGRALGFQIPRENNLMEVVEVGERVLTHFKTVNYKPEKKGGEKSMKKLLGYGGLVIALLSQLVSVLGFIPATIADLIGGIFGFGGLISIRTWIESSGLKTKIIGAVGIVLSVLVGVKVLPIPLFEKALAFLLTLAGVTLGQAFSKSAQTRGP